MHQSHQTRLTTLTNQLNLQHNEAINELKLQLEKQDITPTLESKIKVCVCGKKDNVKKPKY